MFHCFDQNCCDHMNGDCLCNVKAAVLLGEHVSSNIGNCHVNRNMAGCICCTPQQKPGLVRINWLDGVSTNVAWIFWIC